MATFWARPWVLATSFDSITACARKQSTRRRETSETARALDRQVGYVFQRHDLVDPKPRAVELALQLAPAIEVHFHVVNAPVGHPAVAHAGLQAQGPAKLAQQPEAALRIAKIEPEIVHVERQHRAGAEDAGRLAESLTRAGRVRIMPSVLNMDSP